MNKKTKLVVGILVVACGFVHGSAFAQADQTDTQKSMRLTPPSTRLKRPTDRNPIRESGMGFSWKSEPTKKVVSSLAVVLGGFLLLVVLLRLNGRNKYKETDELIRVIGRKAITPKHHLHLVQVHDKILLLVETANGLQKLESIAGVDTADLANRSNPAAFADEQDSERLLEMIQQRSLGDKHLNLRNLTA